MIRLENTQVAALAKLRASHGQPMPRIARGTGLVAIILSLLYTLISLSGAITADPAILGMTELIIGIGILGLMIELYMEAILHLAPPNTPLSERVQAADWTMTTNIAEYLSFEVVEALLESGTDASYDLGKFSAVMFTQNSARTILTRSGLVGELKPEDQSGQAPAVAQPVDSTDTLLAYAALVAVEAGHERIQVSDVLSAMADHLQRFANLLFAYHIEKVDLISAIAWFDRNEQSQQRHRFWERGNVGSYGIGRDWSSGYTPTLSQYSIDLSRYIQNPELVSRMASRHDIIDRITAALSSEDRAHVLLVGAPGIGKKTIVNGVAAQIASGDVPRSLADKHVMQLDVNQLLAGLSGRGEIEARLLKVLNDAQAAGNIVLFINNIHTLLGASEGTVGAVNAAALLVPALKSGSLQVIASTTPQDYHNIVIRQSAVAEAFTRVDVEEPTDEQTMAMLQSTALHLEYRLGVFISVPVIRTVIANANRYLHQEPRPENAIGLLEAVATAVSNRGEYLVTVPAVEAVVSEISKVPVGAVAGDEKEKLLHIDELLHNRVVGQDEAITAVAQALKRARSGLSSSKRPIGSFLFLGPTGVGKTETAKALAAAYFGNEQSMLRFDMSEYQSPAALETLIGSATSAEAAGPGQLTSQVRDKPFSLILLDELEKAHPDVLNVFLQVLDEGHVTDGLGQKIDFTNTIIIATSNAGSEFIREQVATGKAADQFQSELLNELQTKGIFKPEFVNRFDGVIAFKPLTPEQLTAIVDLQLAELNTRLAEQQVIVELTPEAKAELARRGYQPEFGARALRRVMQTAVENVVANHLLAGTIQRGQTITLDVADLDA